MDTKLREERVRILREILSHFDRSDVDSAVTGLGKPQTDEHVCHKRKACLKKLHSPSDSDTDSDDDTLFATPRGWFYKRDMTSEELADHYDSRICNM